MLISRFVKHVSLAMTEATLLILGIFYSPGNAQAATLTPTLPEYTGTGGLFFPPPPQTVGIFTFTLPTDETITSAVIQGTFGNSIFPTSAAVDIYLDNLLVAQCFESTPAQYSACWEGPGPVAWQFTLDESHFAILEDEMAVLTAVQTSLPIFKTRLGETTLTIETAATQPPASVPEPTTILGLVGVGISLLAVRKNVRSR